MDSVPLAFCDSVCAQLHITRLEAFRNLGRKNSAYRIWKAAAASRQLVSLSLKSSDDSWSYSLVKETTEISFAQLLQLEKRRVHLYAITLDGHEPVDQKCEFAEILQIVRFVAPCVNLGCLNLLGCSSVPEEELTHILSTLERALFQNFTANDLVKPMKEFLKVLLPLNTLKNLSLFEADLSQELRDLIEDYTLTKPFDHFDLFPLEFSKEFLGRLLEKPLVAKNCNFDAKFSCDFQEFKDLRSEIQDSKVVSNGEKIVWKREDGVEVVAFKGKWGSEKIEIEFARW